MSGSSVLIIFFFDRYAGPKVRVLNEQVSCLRGR